MIMPWSKKSEKAGEVYEALRRKGYSKEKAAKIAVSESGQPLVLSKKERARRKKRGD